MIDPNLLSFIEENQAQGRSEDIIRELLLENGWQQASIDEAFASLSGTAPVQSPVPQNQPVQPAPGPVPPTGEVIEDVSVSTADYLKKHPAYVTIPIIIALALELLAIALKTSNIAYYICPIFLPIGGYSVARGKIQHEFMQQFAAANGYTYAPTGKLDGLDGALFNIGRNKSVVDFITGQYETRPISLFTYNYITGSGKSQQTHPNTVFELQFNVMMPDIFLKNNSHALGESFFENLGGKETVKLEGDFNKYFNLYITKGYEVEALEIFTPDVMEELVEKAKGLSLEIVHDHCFVYATKILSTKQSLDALYQLAEYFDQKLGPLLSQMKGSVEAMNAVLSSARQP